jgi:UDP-N-acetylmuramyl pentapeptide phosphotransferase/UDP-N-acetylglucosamine-1-phosphate transferase
MTDDTVRLIVVAAVVFGCSVILTGFLAGILKKNNILDIPNERSSHIISTPRGGGIGIVSSIIIGWIVDRTFIHTLNSHDIIILGSSFGLAIVCFIDDIRGLPAASKLIFQIVFMFPGFWIISETGGMFRGWLDIELDILFTGLLWLWFINLFNFMDGIDGLTGVEVFVLGLGLAVFSVTGIINEQVLGPSIIFMTSALGFLVWNWAPAKVFLGDVGSIPLGYLIGWSLISITSETISHHSLLVIILILPGYYLADASITLGGRILKRKNIFEAHRDHFYQKAVQNGASHSTVCLAVLVVNILLLLIALMFAGSKPIFALITSGVVIGILFLWMLRKQKN